jgi:hypothetical protein
MDPLSALSVAAAVVQFADYGTGLLRTGRALYKSINGALSENIDLEAASDRIRLLGSNVGSRPLYRLQVR